MRVKKIAAIKNLSESEKRSLTTTRAKLRRDIIKWRKYQYEHYPLLRDHIPPVDMTTPENDNLFLPSAIPRPLRELYQVMPLAQLEYDLREGQAHDALNQVRDSIKDYSCNLAYKKAYVFGQHPSTRAHEFLCSLARNKVAAADKYRNARNALLGLGLSDNDSTFQPLEDSDLWMKNVVEPHVFGGSRIQDPWFWTVGRPSGLSENEETEWTLEGAFPQFLLRLLIRISIQLNE